MYAEAVTRSAWPTRLPRRWVLLLHRTPQGGSPKPNDRYRTWVQSHAANIFPRSRDPCTQDLFLISSHDSANQNPCDTPSHRVPFDQTGNDTQCPRCVWNNAHALQTKFREKPIALFAHPKTSAMISFRKANTQNAFPTRKD